MPQCAVSFCKAKKPPFHPFPKDDQQLFDIWKGCVSRFGKLTDEEISKQYSVCDDHFVASCKIPGTNDLKKCSIPTKNVPGFKINSNLNIAYNLYIEKQENDPVYLSVKSITLDHNYANKILIDRNKRMGIEDLDNCTFINLNNEPKPDLITKVWVDQDVPSVIEDLPTDLLSNNIDHEGQNKDTSKILEDNDIFDQEIISMPNITDPLLIEVKKEPDINQTALKNYCGPNKQTEKIIKPKKLVKSRIKCYVSGCKNKYGSFHKFPTNPELNKKWKDALEITGEIKDYVKICSMHFKNTDYFTKLVSFGNSRRVLKRTAIPFKGKLELKKIICAANNCYNNNIDHKTMNFFKFPRDEALARTWASNADRHDLLQIPKFKGKQYYLCANHFNKRCFKNSSRNELRSDITIIPKVFNKVDSLTKPGDLYSNLFMPTSEMDRQPVTKSDFRDKKFSESKVLQTYVNDSDLRKITFEAEVDGSLINHEYGALNFSHSIYEDFVSNPGVLDLKPEPSDLLFKKDYCRLCAKLCSLAALSPLSDQSEGLTESGRMLEACLPGKVRAGDGLPQLVCSKCQCKLEACFSSIRGFLEAENQLRNMFNKDGPASSASSDSGGAEQVPGSNGGLPEMPPEVSEIIEEKRSGENVKYQCLACDQLFSSKRELVEHSRAEHKPNANNPLGNSVVCKVVKTSANSVKLGTSAKVKCSKLRYECVMCSSLHEKKDSLIKHSLQYHSQSGSNGKIVCRVVRVDNLRNKNLNCLHCKEQFGNISKYRKHMKQHLKLNCEQCGQQFSRNYRLLAHLKLHEAKSVPCSKDQLESNVSAEGRGKKKHERPLSLCNICGKLFSSATLLKYHLEKHADARSHVCTVCAKAFNSAQSLRRHRHTHAGDKRFMCQVCGKQFAYLAVLRSHMLSHSAQRPHACDVCGAAFRRRNNLKKHLTTHEKIKEDLYKCNMCDLEFGSRVECVRHGREHASAAADRKSFSCDICSKDFLTRFQVKVHRRIHTGEAPYACAHCPKAFRSRALLRQHGLIHMNVFPHQCNYCDRKFRRLQSLVVHRRTHTGEKPYPCPICARPFANRSDMNKHKCNLHNRKHNIEAEKQFDIDNLINQVENNDLHSNSNNNSNMLTSVLNE